MTSFFKKPRKKVEILKDEDHIILLKNINLTETSNQYNLKDIVERDCKKDTDSKTSSVFTIIDENAVNKKPSRFKEKLTSSKSKNDITNFASNLEKLGISNKELILTETFYKDDAGKEIKMLLSGTNEYITKDCRGCCWWCRLEIPSDWHPLGLPIKMNDKKRMEFLCEGLFCSFNCIMSYAHTLTDVRYKDVGMYVTLLYRQVIGRDCWITKIIPAPSWKNLRQYGGKLTAEEYRSTFNKLTILERRQYNPETFTMHPLQTMNLVE